MSLLNMSVPLPVRRAEYSFLTSGGKPVGTLLLDPETDTLYSRRREDLDDDAITTWVDEMPEVSRELGAARYLEILEDRLSNAIGLTERERVFVRDFPAALERLHVRKVLGEPAPPACLPLYSLRAAAGRFGEDMEVEPEGSLPDVPGLRAGAGAYAVHIRGRSMEPLVPDGATAVFRPITGSRQGRRVLVWHRASSQGGGEYTIKVYRSEKRTSEDGWEHSAIFLEALNPEFEPIMLDEDTDDYRILGEFVMVLGIEDTL
ncbi:MAG TPA: S24 family peptidase [Bryobacteraceae bacterium]|nr:S24 family peptidase [Bryobacteraceae bacterium]